MDMKINNIDYVYNTINKALTDKNPTNNGSETVNLINSDIGQISSDANKQYEYLCEIEGTTATEPTTNKSQNTFLSSDAINPSFIVDYSEKYAQMSKDIIANNSKADAEKKLELLEKAYKDSIDQGIKSLASDFQGFFNYAAGEWGYDKSNAPQFNTDEFISNLKNMANIAYTETKNAIKQGDYSGVKDKVNEKLTAIKSGTTIETMSYNDIQAVDDFLKTIPNLKNHVKEYFDDGTYRPAPGNWTAQQVADAMNSQYEKAEELVKSGKISEIVGRYVQATTSRNVSAFQKNFSYGVQMDIFQAEINKNNKFLDLLKSQQAEFNRKLLEFRKKNNMKAILIYLEALKGVANDIDALNGKAKKDNDNKNNLQNNPNSIVDSGIYKDISSRLNFKVEDIKSAS